MPYIIQEERQKFDKWLDEILTIKTKGELEYCIFTLMARYMSDKRFCYSNLHDTVYAAIHCGDEYRRRYMDSREDDALSKNGDVNHYSGKDDIGEV
jgi:hypothetical protein